MARARGHQRHPVGPGNPADHPFDWSLLLKNWDLTLPAAVGVIVGFRRRHQAPEALFPVVWLSWMLVVFAIHRPWWPYYYVHLALPLGWCAAIGIVQGWQVARRKGKMTWRLALGSFALCAMLWMGARVYLQVRDIRSSPRVHSTLVLHELDRLKPFVRYIYADEPVYSFHAGIPMPPSLAMHGWWRN